MLEIDFESRSPVDLRARGAYRYWEDPRTQAMIASYTIDEGPIKRWRRGEPCPPAIRKHIEVGGLVYAHSAQFERLAINCDLSRREDWPSVTIEQMRCTAAMAAAMSLPRDLDRLGQALGLTEQKDKDGHALMMRMSKARRPRKGEDPRGLYWHDAWLDPDQVERLHSYCDQDVRTEAAAKKVLYELSDYEWSVFHLNERINDRGLRIDLTSAHAAMELTEKSKKLLNDRMTEITQGYVTACTAVASLTSWLRMRGLEVGGVGKPEMTDLLEKDDLDDDVRAAIETRLEAAKVSVSKLKAFIDRASDNGRAKGSYVYHAAGTGRYSSRGAQMHNLARPRPSFKYVQNMHNLFSAFRTQEPELLPALYGDDIGRPMHLVSDAIRGFIWAAPGHEFLVVDFSSIEGRVNAWLAGDDEKIEAFRASDRDEGPDLYKVAAASIYVKDPYSVNGDERQTGKVAELALGYQGGVSALLSMAKGYALKLDPAYPALWEAADDELRERAEKRHAECAERQEPATLELTREGWIAAELIKIGWRSGNQPIVDSWGLLEDGARQAVLHPGETMTVLKVQFRVARGFLWMRLPSGRTLAYGGPRIADVEVPWADKTKPKAMRETRKAVTVLGVDSVTQQWRRYALYGGLLCENAVQAIARDCLVAGQLATEQGGFTNVGHTHDEIIAELPKGRGDMQEFERLACTMPSWADGIPVVGSGWRGKRYRKA